MPPVLLVVPVESRSRHELMFVSPSISMTIVVDLEVHDIVCPVEPVSGTGTCQLLELGYGTGLCSTGIDRRREAIGDSVALITEVLAAAIDIATCGSR